MKIPPILPLALAHGASDISHGALPVLLPFFIAAHGLSYAAAGTIVFTSYAVSSVTQPFFGFAADRRSRPWLMPLGIVLSGLGFSLSGVAPSYSLVLLAVAISGLGAAAFHPEGARQAQRVAAGGRRATIMSLFTFGGQIGMALGPVAASGALLLAGLKGTLFFLLTVLCAGPFFFAMHRWAVTGTGRGRYRPTPGQAEETGPDAWRPFFLLTAVVLLRSVVYHNLNTFLPLLWIDVLHQSKAAGAFALSVLAMSGIAGNLLGGRIADRFGYRTAALVEFVLLTCFLPLLPLSKDPTWAVALLVPIGLLLSAPNPSMVVLGQTYLPNHIGLSSGVTMGLAFSCGALVVPPLGRLADVYGLHVVLWIVAFVPAACALLALTLPGRLPQRPPVPTGG